MGKDSKISWCNHTFSGWWGCDEVAEDPACTHCYAREFSKRLGNDLWGDKKPRQMNSEHYWNDPFRWDRAAAKAGVKAKVFCSSMSDIFEDRRDLDAPRERLWKIVEATPNLIWLLLTKRHDCINRMIPASWIQKPRPNVWMGVTAADQKWADERIPTLLSIPAVVRWISAEPLVGPIDFSPWIRPDGISWIVVGGESGHGARRMDPQWARDIRRQCQENGAAFHFKQKGRLLAAELGCKDKEGKEMSEWPEEFRVQEFPTPVMMA